MGAYWSVILPTEVRFSKDPGWDMERFLENFGHLFHQPDKKRKSVFVPKVDIKEQFLDFYEIFMQEVWKKSNKYETLFNISAKKLNVDTLIAQLREGDIFAEKLPGRLNIPDNYYLEELSLAPFVVYEGWPYGSSSSISGMNLLRSGWKYGEDSIVLLHMRDVMEAVRPKFPDMVKLLFICAF